MRIHTLISGAGPTGLTLAIDLARRGIPVRIVDKAVRHPTGSRGDTLQPRTLEVFDDLGIIDRVLRAGAPQPIVLAYRAGAPERELRMTDPIPPSSAVPYPNPWTLGQADTEAILRARLAEFGVEVELATETAGFAADDSGVTVTLAYAGTTETVRADYLIGADGAHSLVRRTLGIEFDGSTDESTRLLLGDVRADALDHTHGHCFASADAATGIVFSPLPGRPHFQVGMPLPAGIEPGLGLLQTAVDTCAGRSDIRLTDLTWCTVWRPNIRLARRFRSGRVLLAGDAAHVHPPTGGQGLNTGVQDAYNLGWKLATGDDELLDTYDIERRAVAAAVLGISTALLHRATSGAEDAHRRDHTHQLDLTYRDPAATGTLVPGDRAPDASVTDIAGQRLRLFDLYRGPHHTLVSFGETAPCATVPDVHVWSVRGPGHRPNDPGIGRHVVDVDGHAFRDYDARPGTVILVRPDGHIAARTDPASSG
ncbi:FAD-dependent monooxygenase [Nocardia vulneris]|uniref:FAD-dependent monooxygenase n=1 Tax=Nocardia vulneris TaxID=1141657 RepID=UPI0030CC52F4